MDNRNRLEATHVQSKEKLSTQTQSNPPSDHLWDFTYEVNYKGVAHHGHVQIDLGLTFFQHKINALTVSVDVTQIGPGLLHERLTLPGGICLYFASTLSPIKPLLQHYTHAMWVPSYVPYIVGKMMLRGLAVQVERDVSIWNSKIYRQDPPLTKVDNKIPVFRKWFKSFYEGAESFEDAWKREQESVEW